MAPGDTQVDISATASAGPVQLSNSLRDYLRFRFQVDTLPEDLQNEIITLKSEFFLN